MMTHICSGTQRCSLRVHKSLTRTGIRSGVVTLCANIGCVVRQTSDAPKQRIASILVVPAALQKNFDHSGPTSVVSIVMEAK